MSQPSFDFADITSNRHKGSVTSVAANKRAAKGKIAWRFLCIDYIRRNGTATLEELCAHFGKTPNQLSGRCTELKALKLIEPTGQTRNGFQVYRVREGSK